MLGEAFISNKQKILLLEPYNLVGVLQPQKSPFSITVAFEAKAGF